MKFAALALTLLLAVGSQAAAMETMPSNIEHHFTMLEMAIDGVKKSLAPLDGTDYSYIKEWIQRTLDVFGNAVTGRKSDIIAFIDTIEETTSESFMADYKRIKDELTPLFGEFRIRDHIAQYFEKLGPIMTQVMAEYRAATDSLIPRVEPQVEELKEIFKVNAWDTKEKLMPILNVFQRELTLAYNKVKEMGRMYGEEYKEHMDSVVERLRSINPENIAAKRPEINKLGNEILEKFIQLQQLVTGEGN